MFLDFECLIETEILYCDFYMIFISSLRGEKKMCVCVNSFNVNFIARVRIPQFKCEFAGGLWPNRERGILNKIKKCFVLLEAKFLSFEIAWEFMW